MFIETVNALLITLVVLRFIGIIICLEFYFNYRQKRYLLYGLGWFIYAVSPLFRIYSAPENVFYSFVYAWTAAIGSYILIIVILFIIFNLRIRPMLWGGAATVILPLIIYLIPPMHSFAILICVVFQLVLLLTFCGLSFIRWREFTYFGKRSSYWVLLMGIIGVFHSFGYIFIYPRTNPPSPYILTITITVLLLLYQIHLENSQFHVKLLETQRTLQDYANNLNNKVEAKTKELKKAQEQIFLQEKMAALGKMADNVAHELRNPLGVISNAAYYLKQVTNKNDQRLLEYIDIINAETRSAAGIIGDLLDYAQLQEPNKKNIGIQELVSESVLHLNIDNDINTELSIAENMGNIYIDPEQINNVIKTLYNNAIQAMPDGGDILIKAQKEHGNLEIVFTDNGCGIKKEYLSKIFEPLFTTKQHHIGLGLATAKQLIELNGGTITVNSQEDQGTSFTIKLPLINKPS